ncbi:MAG: ATP synthase subunit I [Planctomycetota bacterium]|nr:MAG: ATP synthase subunit I [Planctomycetota bacterium]
MNSEAIMAGGLALLGGMGIGGLYFGGLWWTVQRMMNSPRPILWISGSFALRAAAAMAGFYWISGRQWQQVFFCLAGFLVVRWIVLRGMRGSIGGDMRARSSAA